MSDQTEHQIKEGISGKSLVEINADLQSRLTAAETRVKELEQLVCDFQAAAMIDVGNQGGPCRVEPKHVEAHITSLRAELDKLKGKS